MISLSKVIKESCVLFDSDPVFLRSYNKTAKKASQISNSQADVKKMLSKNALESAEISVSAAVKEVEGIKQRCGVESHFAYLNGYNDGIKNGTFDGEAKGNKEGENKADEKFDKAVSNLLSHIKEFDNKTAANNEENSTDCIDFAFGLAENILGIKVDREKDKYREFEKRLFGEKPKTLDIEMNGKTYSIKTLQTDAILNSCDGLQGIFAYKKEDEEEAQEPVEKTNNDAPAEISQKPALNESEETEKQEPKAIEIPKEEEKPQTEDKVKPFITKDFSKTEEEPIEPQNEEKEQPKAEPFVYENFGEEKSETEDEEKQEKSENSQDEKFVFLNPKAKKSRRLCEDEGFTIEDIADFNKDDLKALLKKLEPKDIAAALQNESEETKNTYLSALTPKTKQKVSEAVTYLGPYPDEEVKRAKEQLIKTAESL